MHTFTHKLQSHTTHSQSLYLPTPRTFKQARDSDKAESDLHFAAAFLKLWPAEASPSLDLKGEFKVIVKHGKCSCG